MDFINVESGLISVVAWFACLLVFEIEWHVFYHLTSLQEYIRTVFL